MKRKDFQLHYSGEPTRGGTWSYSCARGNAITVRIRSAVARSKSPRNRLWRARRTLDAPAGRKWRRPTWSRPWPRGRSRGRAHLTKRADGRISRAQGAVLRILEWPPVQCFQWLRAISNPESGISRFFVFSCPIRAWTEGV